MIKKPFLTKAVMFDFDGTLTAPGAIDFAVIKNAVGCPLDTPILEYIAALPDPDQQKSAYTALDEFEIEAARRSKANDGAESLLALLRTLGIPAGLISRNSLDSIKTSLDNFQGTSLGDFDIVLTRDDPVEPKPSPEGIRVAAEKLGIKADQIVVVGDYLFDMQAGNQAGAVTVLLETDPPHDMPNVESDFVVACLDDVKDIIHLGLPLPQGKLPNGLLDRFLDHLIIEDPALLIAPGVGEDTAATDISKDDVLVLKSDPITFATDAVGQYAVLVNANDIATSGATPRWFMTTLLFPPGTTGSSIWLTMEELNRISSKYAITLCGGHTEITDAVTRPVVIGSLVGTVARKDLIDKSSMQPGDKVLMTKAVAVEGTAIIAREFEGRLKSLNVSDAQIRSCRQLLDQVSIMEEAKLAVHIGGVSAMHDVTEGGLATALYELSAAGGYGIRIDMDAIPVFPETEHICGLLDISPFGLIGSGTLLICCRAEKWEKMMEALLNEGIRVSCIGEVLDQPAGIHAHDKKGPQTWPTFEVDEITRLFHDH
jgi:hydrogenase expression/formation protein HypE